MSDFLIYVQHVNQRLVSVDKKLVLKQYPSMIQFWEVASKFSEIVWIQNTVGIVKIYPSL